MESSCVVRQERGRGRGMDECPWVRPSSVRLKDINRFKS